MISFENVKPPAFRAFGVVGDTMAAVVGKPVASSYPILSFDVVDQPSGSDIFNGLGTAGAAVPFTSLDSATLTASGWYSMTVTGANGDKIAFDFVVWPTSALNVDGIKYPNLAAKNVNQPQGDPARRSILRSLALHATKGGVEASLEGGAAVAGNGYGTRPSDLGATAVPSSLAMFGGW